MWSKDYHFSMIEEIAESIAYQVSDYDGILDIHNIFADEFYEECGDDMDKDEFFDDGELWLEDFNMWLNDRKLPAILNNLFYVLSKKSDEINIYRGMSDVRDGWVRDVLLNDNHDKINLGVYWSFEKNFPDYWNNIVPNKKEKIILHAKVNKRVINLEDTYYANVINNNECEINLKPNTPLKLVSVERDGVGVDLSNLNKSVFS